jgi:transposase
LGRSRGGLSTKIHMVTDALGHPLRFILTGGQVSDYKPADQLLENLQARYVLADKGYDSQHLVDLIQTQGAEVVIPPKANRKIQREYDREIYKQRNWIERAFNRLKYYRRIATRYDRKTLYYASFLYLAAGLCWG